MLDKSKLFFEIQKLSDSIFFDISKELNLAQECWNKICSDEDFLHKIEKLNSPWILPTWKEPLNKKIKIEPFNNYTVIATDGSQIYPDRHQGTSCFLINISSIFLKYGIETLFIHKSAPFVYGDNEIDCSADVVDCIRQELEFLTGFETFKKNNSVDNNTKLFLFDGSIIFWHLDSKDAKTKELYLNKYLYCLQQFYKNNFLIAGYISMPKSRELVNLLKIQLCDFQINNCDLYKSIDNLLDTHIANFYLDEYERSIIFKNHSSIVQTYPEYLHPHFFYLNVGQEIVRIEIPQWIAQDEKNVEIISKIIVDQCKKGFGYPICLAEAHEEAVIKNADREFFYELIHKLGIKYNHNFFNSQKSLKKRRMGI